MPPDLPCRRGDSYHKDTSGRADLGTLSRTAGAGSTRAQGIPRRSWSEAVCLFAHLLFSVDSKVIQA
jgi:hypothetical protein